MSARGKRAPARLLVVGFDVANASRPNSRTYVNSLLENIETLERRLQTKQREEHGSSENRGRVQPSTSHDHDFSANSLKGTESTDSLSTSL